MGNEQPLALGSSQQTFYENSEDVEYIMFPGPSYISNVWTQGLFHVSLQQDGASSSWLLIGIENVRYLPKNVFHDSKERKP